jgi:hypothetical protein
MIEPHVRRPPIGGHVPSSKLLNRRRIATRDDETPRHKSTRTIAVLGRRGGGQVGELHVGRCS